MLQGRVGMPRNCLSYPLMTHRAGLFNHFSSNLIKPVYQFKLIKIERKLLCEQLVHVGDSEPNFDSQEVPF